MRFVVLALAETNPSAKAEVTSFFIIKIFTLVLSFLQTLCLLQLVGSARTAIQFIAHKPALKRTIE
jgi:hypothetical protein